MDEVYSQILGFLESAGFKKSARRFRKESKCDLAAPNTVDLAEAIVLYRKRQRRRAGNKNEKQACGEKNEEQAYGEKNKEQTYGKRNEDQTPEKREPQEDPSLEPLLQEKVMRKRHKGASDERFRRIDDCKYLGTVSDPRLLDQSYAAKKGDAFAGDAAVDLGRVRGKDFRKEMQKKKRASWKGAGRIDMGVNSVQFEDSSS